MFRQNSGLFGKLVNISYRRTGKEAHLRKVIMQWALFSWVSEKLLHIPCELEMDNEDFLLSSRQDNKDTIIIT